MINRWNATGHDLTSSSSAGAEVASCLYMLWLAGAEADLATPGEGSGSVKTSFVNTMGDILPCLCVTAAFVDMRSAAEADLTRLDLAYLRRLRALSRLSDSDLIEELSLHQLAATCAHRLSVEALLHAFLPAKYILHTHPVSLLAIGSQPRGREMLMEAIGEQTIVIPSGHSAFDTAKAAAEAFEQKASSTCIVIIGHGLVTWGESAQQAYCATIAAVSSAENFLEKRRSRVLVTASSQAVAKATGQYRLCAPVVRRALSVPSNDADRPFGPIVLQRLGDAATLALLQQEGMHELLGLALSSASASNATACPLTLWIDHPALDDPNALRGQIERARSAIATARGGNKESQPQSKRQLLLPAVVFIPGLGAICAAEKSSQALSLAHTIRQMLRVGACMYEAGGKSEEGRKFWEEMGEKRDEDFGFRGDRCPIDKHIVATFALEGRIALVTGAAGAIGSAICEALLSSGGLVAAADYDQQRLEAFVGELRSRFGDRIIAAASDITNEASIASAFDTVVETWGGIDLVVANAGIAHVSSLASMRLEDFQRLERVNIDGTLLTICEAARRFALQNMGGDIVLISSKNVFAPGAAFGAYSATKAAAHQLARIASLELAEIDVRVNMVAPDAVFAHRDRKSGLWAAVAPDRMRARGLDEKGLQEYYRKRNLLKVSVSAEHVARAVLFFATRQTPTTGATIPVDGGLPEAAPR